LAITIREKIINIIKYLTSLYISFLTALMALATMSMMYLKLWAQSLSEAFKASLDKILKKRAPEDEYDSLEKKSMLGKNLIIL
jgi:hypothetical protein